MRWQHRTLWREGAALIALITMGLTLRRSAIVLQGGYHRRNPPVFHSGNLNLPCRGLLLALSTALDGLSLLMVVLTACRRSGVLCSPARNRKISGLLPPEPDVDLLGGVIGVFPATTCSCVLLLGNDAGADVLPDRAVGHKA